MREKELIRRADLALSDLSTAGLMNTEQFDRFLRKMMEEPTLLQDVRTIRMNRPSLEINKIGFGTRMLRPANNTGLISSPRSGEEGTRALARADRYKPTTEKITLDTKEIMAEIDLPYEVLEDNIEGGQIDNTQFENTILDLMGQRAALDLEEWLIKADTGSGDAYLALQDGVLKRTTSNVVNHASAPISADLFANMIKALPLQYHRLLNQFRFYLPTLKEIDYRMQVAQRQTQLGDSILTGGTRVNVLGVPMIPASQMPTTNMLFTIPRNIIWGVWRNVRIEYDRDIRERAFVIVLTMRVGQQIEEETMMVKATNVG